MSPLPRGVRELTASDDVSPAAGASLDDSDDEDEFGEPREFASKIAVKKIAEDIINDIMTTW